MSQSSKNNTNSKQDLSNSNSTNNYQNAKLKRPITPPKRPAVLCRKSQNTSNQNTLLQSSNNKHNLNMPSPLQTSQMWINNQLDPNQLSIQLCTPNSTTIDTKTQNSSTNIASNSQNSSFPFFNATLNSSIATNTFTPLNSNQPITDLKTSSFNQQPYNDFININNNNINNNNINNYNNKLWNNNNNFDQKGQYQQNKSNNRDKNNQNEEISQYQDNIQNKKQERIQQDEDKYEKQDLEVGEGEEKAFERCRIDEQGYKNGKLNTSQQTQELNQSKCEISRNNSMFSQVNFLPSQNQTKAIKNEEQNGESNLSSIKQEIGVICLSTNQQQQNMNQQQEQTYNNYKKNDNSHKVMMQMSEEIEKLNKELKDKHKQYLQLEDRYEDTLEEMKVYQFKLENIIQTKQQIIQHSSESDSQKISILLAEIQHLTHILNHIPPEKPQSDGNNELKQKIQQLIEINDSLLAENKQLGEENISLAKDIQINLQVIHNLNNTISDQEQTMQRIQIKNEKILSKYMKLKAQQENKKDIQKEKQMKSQAQVEENFDHHFQNKNQSEEYEEEIENIKYLLKEKMHEIDYWKNKASSYQSDYEQLEKRLQTSLKSNDILNKEIMKFSNINQLEIVSKEQLQYQSHQVNDEEKHEYNDFEGGEGEDSYPSDDQQEMQQYKQVKYDRYNMILDQQSSIEDDSALDRNPYRKNTYGLTQSQNQNRFQEFQGYPLQEQVNNITNRKQDYFDNEIVDSETHLKYMKRTRN